MTTSGTHARDSGSAVHDGRMTLDLRKRPTRAEVGLNDAAASRSYERSGAQPLQVKVELPGGSVSLPCFVVTVATDATGGVSDTVATHQPKFFVLNRRFPNSADARAAMVHDGKLLGLHADEIGRIFPDLGTGAAVPQSRVLHGLVRDWLSLEITVNDIDDGQVQAVYTFSIDEFHNPAVDKVVHDNVFGIDLTRRPSRAALGFLPTYPTATVRAPYGQVLHVDLRLADGGRVAMPVDSVTSTSSVNGGPDPDGVGEPRMTTIVRTSSVADAHAELRRDAAALGIADRDVAGVFDGAGTVRTTLTGRDTASYAVKVTVSANLAEPGAFAASLRYTFTYR